MPPSFGNPQVPGPPLLPGTLVPGLTFRPPARSHFQSIWRHRWRVISVIAIALGLTYGVSSLMTPMYEATATVDIDVRMPSGILGSDAC